MGKHQLRLFSNRSQMTSKCGKNKKVAHEAQPSVSLMLVPHFDVLCDLLLNRRTATWNLFVLYNKKIKIHGKNALFLRNGQYLALSPILGIIKTLAQSPCDVMSTADSDLYCDSLVPHCPLCLFVSQVDNEEIA